MTGKTFSSDPHVGKLVEKQMRNWEIARAQQVDKSAPCRPEVQHFISMSNAVGAGGNDIAALLSDKLHWPVFDKGILLAMANDDEVRARLYRSMDERDLGWLEEMLRWLTQEEFRKNDYFRRLTETVLCLARQHHAIFLGRAADLILPRNRGLRVKIVASPEYRIAKFARDSQISLDEARAAVERIEHERADFIRHHFPHNPGEHQRFDLIINTERFSTHQAAELILAAMRLRSILP